MSAEPPQFPDRVELDGRAVRVSGCIDRGTFVKVFTGYLGPFTVRITVLYPSQWPCSKEEQVKLVDMLHRECEHLKNVHHENLAVILGSGETPQGHVFMVDQYAGRRTLKCVLQYDRRTDIPMKEREDAMLQCLRGLGYLHQHKLVHGSISPANIHVIEDGTIKLSDYVTALRMIHDVIDGAESSRLSVDSVASYVSPNSQMDAQSDVWSLGSVFYEFLSHGDKPFPEQADDALGPGIRPTGDHKSVAKAFHPRYQISQTWSDIIINKMLKHNPNDRSDARALLSEATGTPLPAPPAEWTASRLKEDDAPAATNPPASKAWAGVPRWGANSKLHRGAAPRVAGAVAVDTRPALVAPPSAGFSRSEPAVLRATVDQAIVPQAPSAGEDYRPWQAFGTKRKMFNGGMQGSEYERARAFPRVSSSSSLGHLDHSQDEGAHKVSEPLMRREPSVSDSLSTLSVLRREGSMADSITASMRREGSVPEGLGNVLLRREVSLEAGKLAHVIQEEDEVARAQASHFPTALGRNSRKGAIDSHFLSNLVRNLRRGPNS